jgi:hypothetical protein
LKRLPRFEPVEEQLDEVDLEARVTLPGHLVGVVLASSRLDEARFIEPLLEALAARGVNATVERLPALGAAPSLEALRARLPERAPFVTVGASGVALLRPRIAIGWTGGMPPRTWSPAARAVRPALHLELAEPRRGVLHQVAAHPTIIACRGAC